MNGKKCSYLKIADGYVHGELEKEELREFEKHLLECMVCSEEVISVRSLSGKLNAAYEVSLPHSFGLSVVRNLKSSKHVEAVFEIKLAAEDIAIALATFVAIVIIALQIIKQPKISSEEIAGRLTPVEQASLQPEQMSKDDVLELVLTGEQQQQIKQAVERKEGK